MENTKRNVITMADIENAIFGDDVIITREKVQTTHADGTRFVGNMQFSLEGMPVVKGLELFIGATLTIRRQGGVKQAETGEIMEKVLSQFVDKPVHWEDAGKKPEADPMSKILAMLDKLPAEQRAIVEAHMLGEDSK